ncbi:choice-of-anchor P family protein [Nocardioides alcanivorans]|uniref:choice-of-anchor P family protein n=1 Tax=Nocardioides alcanivorans TaxID=2897352 RepID=UPI001F18A2A9|nr:choice-of-anchor P family protein [Nocardioides alcanivorans]
MRTTVRALAATAVVGVLLPWGVGGPALADDTTPAVEETPAVDFGYSARAWSTPVHVEVYEPSLPIPATPQLEFMMAYSLVKSDGGSSSGRASWFWPGDPVGEGLKTFAEQLGLPAQLFEGGYPVQVNAQHPSDEEAVADEPFPGMVMRAEAAAHEASSSTGFTPDGSVEEADAADNPVAGLLKGLGLDKLAGTAKADQSVPGMPAGLGAIVDFNGYVATSSSTVVDGEVKVTSRSTLGDVSLLGGLIKLTGVKAVATTLSDGDEVKATSKNNWGGLSILGQEFSIGPEGIEAVGQKQGIPGLSNNPAKALEQLGITITVPEQVRESEGRKGEVLSRGLQLEIKTDLLRPVLAALPFDKIGEMMPDAAGPLKSVVSGLGGLAPRIVVTLGEARSTLETVTAMAPPVDEPAPADPPTEENPTSDPAPSDDAAVPTSEAPTDPGAPSSDVPESAETTADLPPSQAASSAGLPKLFSIPGVLTLGAIALAVGAGSWFRRAGLLALGAGGACTHGLDTGLPDLRKV